MSRKHLNVHVYYSSLCMFILYYIMSLQKTWIWIRTLKIFFFLMTFMTFLESFKF